MKKSFDKDKYIEEQKVKKEELKQKIIDITNNFSQDPDKLAEFVSFQHKFHNYSYRNTILIYEQNPGAMFVGSFKKFKDISDELANEHNLVDNKDKPLYLGVKKGEKGMQIYVPVTVTLVCIDSSDDIWRAISECDEATKMAAKKGLLKTKTELHYKIGTVFDISQTNIPLEYYPAIIKDSFGYESEQHAAIFKGLKNYITTQLNCPVTENLDDSISIRGVCHSNSGIIDLNTRLKDTQKLSTLAHELGHYLMHSEVSPYRSSDITVPRTQMEIEADVYSIMLENHFGIEPNQTRKEHLFESYKSYLENEISDPENFDEVKTIEKIINKATNVFNQTIEGIDNDVQKAINEFQISTENIQEEVYEFEL